MQRCSEELDYKMVGWHLSPPGARGDFRVRGEFGVGGCMMIHGCFLQPKVPAV